jgi:MFS family permease
MLDANKLQIASFLDGMYFFIPILTLYMLDNGVGISTIVIAQVFYSIVSFSMEMPTGLLADKYGQKLSIVLGYLSASIGVVLLYFYPDAFGLYVCYSFMGLAGAFLSGSQEALLFEYMKETEKSSYQKAYAAMVSSGVLGVIVSSAIAGLMVQQYGASSYPWLIAMTAGAVFLAGLVSTTLSSVRAQISKDEEGSGVFSALKDSWKLILTNKTVKTLAMVSILTLNGYYFLQTVYQPLFESVGVDPLYLGLAVSLGTIVHFVLVRYSYLLEKYLHLQNILLVINLGIAFLYFAMAFVTDPILLVLAYIILQGIIDTERPVLSDYINERTKSSIRSTVLSCLGFSRQFCKALLRIGLGALVGVFSIPTTLFLYGCYILVGIGIGYWLMVRCGCTYRIKKHIESY